MPWTFPTTGSTPATPSEPNRIVSGMPPPADTPAKPWTFPTTAGPAPFDLGPPVTMWDSLKESFGQPLEGPAPKGPMTEDEFLQEAPMAGKRPAGLFPSGKPDELHLAKGRAEVKDWGGKALGMAAQASDMLIGSAKQRLGGWIYYGARLGTLGEDARKSVEAANMARDYFFPPEISAPFAKIAESLGPQAKKAYYDNPVAYAMNWISKGITHGVTAAAEKSGLQPEDYMAAIDIFMGGAIHEQLKPAVIEAWNARTAPFRAAQAAKAAGPVAGAEEFPEPDWTHGLKEAPPADHVVDKQGNTRPPVAPAADPHVYDTEAAREEPAKREVVSTGELWKILQKPGFERTAKDKIRLRDAKNVGQIDQNLLYGMAGVGLGALAAGYAYSQKDNIDPALASVIAAGAFGAIKPKGGMWHPEAARALAEPIMEKLTPNVREAASGELSPGQQWAHRAVTNYLNKHAGTETDPLKDIPIPMAGDTARWEDVTDKVFGSRAGTDTNVAQGFEKFNVDRPEERIWQIYPGRTGAAGIASGALTSYLSHVGDYLREHVPPEKLGQYDFVRAVRETSAQDVAQANAMQDAEGYHTNKMPLHKDYGDGMRWVMVKGPEQLDAEQAATIKKVPEGYQAFYPHGQPIWRIDPFTKQKTSVIEKSPELAYNAGLLANEGNVMGHCVGGYCEEVHSGESKIYSLRDQKGMSHVTVEVALRRYIAAAVAQEGAFGVEGKTLYKAWRDARDQGAPESKYFLDYLERYHPEFYKKEMGKTDILQIKGKQNRAPVARYLPYVQDFVRSEKWGDVRDISNAGMVKHEGGYLTIGEAAKIAKQKLESDLATNPPPGRTSQIQFLLRDINDPTRPGYKASVYSGLDWRPNEFVEPSLGGRQRGFSDAKTLTAIAAGVVGLTAGAYLNKDDHPILGAAMGLGLTIGGLGLISHMRMSPEERAMARDLSDELHKISNNSEAFQLQTRKYIGENVLKNAPDLLGVNDSDIHIKHTSELTPRQADLKNQFVQPILDANVQIRGALEALGVNVGEPIKGEFQHRIVRGKKSTVLEQVARAAPVGVGRSMSTSASSLKAREAFAMVSDAGDRLVVTAGEAGKKPLVWQGGKVLGYVDKFDRKAGEITWKGQTWKVDEAGIPEIEANTKIQYNKSALGSAIQDNAELGRALGYAQFLDKAKPLLVSRGLAVPKGVPAPADWRGVSIDQFHGWQFAPHLADVLDDFSGHARGELDVRLAHLSRLITGSMFWTPFPHIVNVLLHNIVEKGLTAWTVPKSVGQAAGGAMGAALGSAFGPGGVATGWAAGVGGVKFAATTARAWRAVTEQNADYMRYLKEGAGLMYPSTILQTYSQDMMKMLGQQPQEATALAKAFGYTGVPQLLKGIYQKSRESMWFANDVIMMQAYFDKESGGMTRSQAMTEVEKHIPNYRIPGRVAGSRMISLGLQSPVWTAFGRYDFGRMLSYAEMVKGLVSTGVPLAERAHALDQFAMLGFLGLVVYPSVLDKAAQAITGNPNATAQRFGPVAIPQLLYEYYYQNQDLNRVVQSAFPSGALLRAGEELYNNRNMFTGSHLIDQTTDIPGFIAQQFSPAYSAGRIANEKMTFDQFVAQSVGIKSPSDTQLDRRAAAQEREATRIRRKHEREAAQ